MAITVTQRGLFVGVPPTDPILATFYAWQNNQVGIFGCHYKITAIVGGGTSLGGIAFGMQTAVDGILQSLMATDVSILGCKVAILDQIPYPLPGIATSTSTGALVAPTLPGQASGIITKVTEFSGRKYRGRVYVPFPAPSQNDVDNTPTDNYVSNLLLLSQQLFAQPWTITDDGGNMVTVLAYLRQKLAPHNLTPITGGNPRKEWATQKRRGDYGRTNSPVIP